MKMLRAGCVLAFYSLAGCAATTISNTAPYTDLIGQCYKTQKPMLIRRNVCRDIGGDLVISPDQSRSCFKEVVVATVEQGQVFYVRDIREKGFGTWGTCVQMVVSISLAASPAVEVFVPLCGSRDYLSWTDPAVLRPGEILNFRADYAKRCEDH